MSEASQVQQQDNDDLVNKNFRVVAETSAGTQPRQIFNVDGNAWIGGQGANGRLKINREGSTNPEAPDNDVAICDIKSESATIVLKDSAGKVKIVLDIQEGNIYYSGECKQVKQSVLDAYDKD